MPSLEQELQQKRFLDERQKMALNIMFTAGWLGIMGERNLRPHGLTSQQFNILRILRGKHPEAAGVGDISSRMIDRSSNVSRLIEKLRLKGLVSRETDTEDRRAVRVKISAKGLTLLTRIDGEAEQWREPLLTLNEGEAKTLNRLLDKLRG